MKWFANPSVLLTSLALFAAAHVASAQTVLYVDDNAPGGNGLSWSQAFNDLQDALDAAATNPNVAEIWIAAGAYRPTERTSSTNARSATFTLIDDLAIYGGFPYGGAWQDRNPISHETILSGDLSNNDGPDFANNYDNAYHVVRAINCSTSAILDGCTITAGNANGYDYGCIYNGDHYGYGAAIFINDAAPTINDCLLTENHAANGAAAVYDDSQPTFSNCRFTDNLATNSGGALWCFQTAAIIQSCVFEQNSTIMPDMGPYLGGAIATYQSYLNVTDTTFDDNYAAIGAAVYATTDIQFHTFECYQLTNHTPLQSQFHDCTFIDNTAEHPYGAPKGAAFYLEYGSNYLIQNCRFFNNTAAYGGAIYNGLSHPAIVNCLFSNNTATLSAGGIGNASSNPTITNCTFASNNGDGINNSDSSAPVIQNSIFWNNSPNQIGGNGPAAIAYCDIQGWTSGGTGNRNQDPQFADPDGADNILGTLDDDLRLLGGSPCIDTGNNNADTDAATPGVQPLPALDLDSQPRLAGPGPIVDMGPYETAESSNPVALLLTTNQLTVPEGATAQFGVSLTAAPAAPVTVFVAVQNGDTDLTIFQPVNGQLLFTASDYDIVQPVTIAAAEDPDWVNGAAHIAVTIPDLTSKTLVATERDNETPPSRLYVDDSAPAGGDGGSWAGAFDNLQDALATAQLMPESVEVVVAAGRYTPDPTGTDRNTSFTLVNAARLYGGYAGYGQPDPDLRDPCNYETILSGDLNDDDGPNFANTADNSRTIIQATSVDQRTLLDGFIIEGANDAPFGIGGGIHCLDADLAINDCVFRENQAGYGAAMVNSQSSPRVTRCRFVDNHAEEAGAAVHNADSSNPFFGNCCFTNNAENAILNTNGALTLVNCVFSANTGGSGGAIWNSSGNLGIINCVFLDNTADFGGGGAVWNEASIASCTNCTFTGNACAGIYYNRGGGAVGGSGSNITIANCVLWDNTDNGASYPGHQVKVDLESVLTVAYSDIQGGAGGVYVSGDSDLNWNTGNISGDPLLDADGRLQAGSAAIDAGNDLVDIDPLSSGLQELVGVDADLNLRRTDDPATTDTGYPSTSDAIVDMGAYEYGAPAIPAVLKVKADALGDNLGDSWPHAMTTLRTALLTVAAAEPLITEVWVAGGTYTPDAANGLRVLPFRLHNDVAVFGGFTGAETSRSQRNPDPTTNATVLSGDLNGNDGPGYTNRADNSYHVIDATYRRPTAILDGFTITAGHADDPAYKDYGAALYLQSSDATIANCRIVGNHAASAAGLYCLDSAPTLDNVSIGENDAPTAPAGVITDSTLHLEQPCRLEHGVLAVTAATIAGPAHLELQAPATLEVTGAGIEEALLVHGRIAGPGLLHIPLTAALIVEENGAIGLDGPTDPCSNVQCDGLFHMRDNAALVNTSLRVTRMNLEDHAQISNSVIDAEIGAPYGQFYVEDNVTIAGNRIFADGDRYLDLAPNVHKAGITANDIYVTITEGKGSTRGGLFELRGLDQTGGACAPDEFLCPLGPGGVPPFDPCTWTLQRLTVEDDAKVTLTNRFEFHPGSGADEVLYVRELVLGNQSVFNTAFNQVYCDELIDDPCAMIVNQPLLGFSLNNIAFDSHNDYVTRVQHNNTIDPADPCRSRLYVQRVRGHALDPCGVMRMENLLDATMAPVNARAQGLFAKADEATVTIVFEYLFENAPAGTELVIYLTDSAEMLEPSDPQRAVHYLEVARLLPPPTGRPGAVGSGRWGSFAQAFPREHLDFLRGVRIEFELEGPTAAAILINNWDPQVLCSELYCKDVTGDKAVTAGDFLTILGEYGNPAAPTDSGRFCLNGTFADDGYVNLYDLLDWDWSLAFKDIFNLCGALTESALPPLTSTSSTMDMLAPSSPQSLIMTSKQILTEAPYLQDAIYQFTERGSYGGVLSPPADHMNGRIVKAPDGQLYVLNYQQGLMRLDASGEIIVPPAEFTNITDPRFSAPASVHVGITGAAATYQGRPIFDAAFDTAGDLYVTGVLVDPNTPADDAPYVCAAKLALLPGQSPPYRIDQLFDAPYLSNDNRELDALREIEVDPAGRVYVLNSHYRNESDLIWQYNPDGTLAHTANMQLDYDLSAPIAMCASQFAPRLYLASADQAPDANDSIIYVLATDDWSLQTQITVQDMGHITAITEDDTGGLWVAGFTMNAIPDHPSPAQPAFYAPALAQVPATGLDTVQAVALTAPGQELAMPLSLVSVPAPACSVADIDASTEVDLADFAQIARYWQATDCVLPNQCAPANIDHRNAVVDLTDLALLGQYWLEVNCGR